MVWKSNPCKYRKQWANLCLQNEISTKLQSYPKNPLKLSSPRPNCLSGFTDEEKRSFPRGDIAPSSSAPGRCKNCKTAACQQDHWARVVEKLSLRCSMKSDEIQHLHRSRISPFSSTGIVLDFHFVLLGAGSNTKISPKACTFSSGSFWFRKSSLCFSFFEDSTRANWNQKINLQEAEALWWTQQRLMSFLCDAPLLRALQCTVKAEIRRGARQWWTEPFVCLFFHSADPQSRTDHQSRPGTVASLRLLNSFCT